MPAELVLLSPLLRRLFDHWRGLAREIDGVWTLPQPRMLDPVAIKWALGWISLIDVKGVPPDCGFH